MGHGLFAVDVFAGFERVDGGLAVPVIWGGDDDGFDVFVVEDLVVVAGGADGLSGDLACEGVAAVVEVAGGDALGLGERDGGSQERRALDADTDRGKADTVTGAD